MESVLWNIAQYDPYSRESSLVSSNWYESLYQNSILIIDELNKTYPLGTIHQSMIRAISFNDIDIVAKILSVNTYIPIHWNSLVKHVTTRRMGELLIPYISIESEITLRKNLNMISMDDRLYRDDPRSIMKLYYYLIRGHIGFLCIVTPRVVIINTINRYGISRFPEKIRRELLDRDIITIDEYNSPMEIISDDSKVIDIIGLYSTNKGLSQIYNALSIQSSIDTITSILEYTSHTSGIENKVRAKALYISMLNGWDHLLDQYLTKGNILLVLSGILLRYPMHPRSWRYISYSVPHSSWFKYYANILSKPRDLDPTLWKKLLANAIVMNNIPLVRSIIQKHRSNITREMEISIMNLSIKNGTYSDQIMSLFQ